MIFGGGRENHTVIINQKESGVLSTGKKKGDSGETGSQSVAQFF